jgi:hypothetical protein
MVPSSCSLDKCLKVGLYGIQGIINALQIMAKLQKLKVFNTTEASPFSSCVTKILRGKPIPAVGFLCITGVPMTGLPNTIKGFGRSSPTPEIRALAAWST